MRPTLILPVFSLLAVPAFLAGCKVTPPSPVEAKTAYWVKHHVTIGGTHDRNPIAASKESIGDGKQLFVSYCMVCHGLDGQNTGVPFAKTMAPQVPALTSPDVQAYTDGQLKWIIKYGIYPSGMPASSGEFSDDDMWAMVNYIRHLPPAGSVGEPNVYGGTGGGGAK